jgi:hypothetical protein
LEDKERITSTIERKEGRREGGRGGFQIMGREF